MSAETRSRVIWPEPDLVGCVFCVIVRDTRESDLPHPERFNFFPASPLASVTWLLEGQCHWIEHPEQMERPWDAPQLQTVAFSGAQLGSLVSWNPGPTLAVTMAFYPDAFSAIAGLDLAPFKDLMLNAEAVLPEPLFDFCSAFSADVASVGLEQALATLQRRIGELWADVRGGRPISEMRLRAWSEDLVARAAEAGEGRSDRQIARRVKAWTGVNQRDLHNLSLTETLYGNILKATRDGGVVWADVASQTGYADQAHMVRRLREQTGFTPEELRQRVARDEALWAYRLLGEFFDRHAVGDTD